jgi:hypothetical protein
MGLLDSLLGRKKPVKANLDSLFALPQAALTLDSAAGFKTSGVGSVCYRANEGAAFATMQSDIQELLDADGGPAVERSQDSYGFTWLVCRQEPDAVSELVTELHTVNTTLEAHGFGPSLLCSVVDFDGPEGQTLGLVYLYKRGTFYPFAPLGDQRRDNALELQIRGLITDDVPVEQSLERWMALWGAPGLS